MSRCNMEEEHNLNYDIGVYKNLICDMIQGITNERFIKQIYSIIYREYRQEYRQEGRAWPKRKWSRLQWKHCGSCTLRMWNFSMDFSTSTPAERGSKHDHHQQGNRRHNRQPVAALHGSGSPGHDDRTDRIRGRVKALLFDTATKPQRAPHRNIFFCFTSCVKMWQAIPKNQLRRNRFWNQPTASYNRL